MPATIVGPRRPGLNHLGAGPNLCRIACMTLVDRRAEFDSHVWNHTDDAFQRSFDHRRQLTAPELFFLETIVNWLRTGYDDLTVAQQLRQMLKSKPDRIYLLLQICGLTRNKIITDLRAVASSLGGTNPPSQAIKLPHHKVWDEVAGNYLATRLRTTLEPLVHLEYIAPALQTINQATWPGYIRQERAKRQGHEAEGRIAALLLSLEIPFEPMEKADNPLSKDARIKGISFDIVIPDTQSPRICIKSTVQTANIGQFGESKSYLEIEEAQRTLSDNYIYNRPLLVAFIDGVGFHSNTAGLHGILETADEFAQFRTLWKIAVLAGHDLDMPVDLVLPEHHAQEHGDFLSKFGPKNNEDILIMNNWNQAELIATGFVEAGEGLVGRNARQRLIEPIL